MIRFRHIVQGEFCIYGGAFDGSRLLYRTEPQRYPSGTNYTSYTPEQWGREVNAIVGYVHVTGGYALDDATFAAFYEFARDEHANTVRYFERMIAQGIFDASEPIPEYVAPRGTAQWVDGAWILTDKAVQQ